MKRLKVAIVGAGKIGHKHALAYTLNSNTTLVAVCDLSIAKAQSMAEAWHCVAYTELEQLLAEHEIDMISIATAGEENGSHHYQPTHLALTKAIPTLTEKPLSNNINEATELVELAAGNRVPLAVNLNHRFVPFADKVKDWIDDGTLGTPLMINFSLCIDNSTDSSEWFHMRALHCHSIDIMRHFCGEVAQVQMFANRTNNRLCWSNVQINMEFESGVIGHLSGSYDGSRHHDIERCEIVASNGRALLENCFEKLSFFPKKSDEVKVFKNCIRRGVKGFDDTFSLRINHWVEQIRQQVAHSNITGSGADALKSQHVIEAAIRSWKNRGAVQEPARCTYKSRESGV